MAHVIEGGVYAPLRGPGQCQACGWFLCEGTCLWCGWIAPAPCCDMPEEERRLYGHREWHRWLAGEKEFTGSPWRKSYEEKMGRA